MRAFVDLLLAEEFESISVATIVARADVGRSTFYTHFRSREDILKASLTFPSTPLASIVAQRVDADSLLPLLAHFRAQQRLARGFASGSLRRLWVRRLAELVEPALARLARRVHGRPVLPLSLASLAIAELQIGLVVHWLASHEPAPPEVVAEALIAATRAATAALLRCEVTTFDAGLGEPEPARP